jgi:hypothetical protein
MQLKRTAGSESGTASEERAQRTSREAARADGRGDADEGARPAGRAAGLRERFGGRPSTSDDRGIRDRITGDRQATAAPERTGDRAVVTEDDIEVMTGGEDLGVYRARRRFGGFDLGAVLAGLLAAVGMTALLGGLAGAIGTVGYQMDVQRDREAMSAGGFITGLVVLVLSFLVGGWVAGRVARYDGGVNGFASAVFFVLLSAVVAGLGAWFGDQYDVFASIRLPQWFTSETNTSAAVLSAIAALVVVLAAGWLGGLAGSRYHRRADKYLAEYAQGGRPVTAETLMDSRGGRRSLLHR